MFFNSMFLENEEERDNELEREREREKESERRRRDEGKCCDTSESKLLEVLSMKSLVKRGVKVRQKRKN